MYTTPTSRPGPDNVRLEDNFEQTLNGTGFMIRDLDEFSSEFVDFATTEAPGPALDIGAAFGVATLAALAGGARVVANDIEPQHLGILESRVPDKDRDRLTLLSGAFPDDVTVEAGSVGCLLAARVLHLFNGPQIERSAAAMFRSLARGGKAFVITESSTFHKFPQLREKYQEQLDRGERWPGFVADVRRLLPDAGDHVPDQVHFLTPDVLATTFEEAGFVVERCEFYQRPVGRRGPSARSRRSVGLIARKP